MYKINVKISIKSITDPRLRLHDIIKKLHFLFILFLLSSCEAFGFIQFSAKSLNVTLQTHLQAGYSFHSEKSVDEYTVLFIEKIL